MPCSAVSTRRGPLAEDVARRQRDSSGWDGAGSPTFADLATCEGDHETAERHLRIVCARMEAIGRQGYLATYAPFLGRTLCALGRYQEAEPLRSSAESIGDVERLRRADPLARVLARVYANRGDVAAAEELAREAVEIVDGTDSLNSQAEARFDLAEVLAAAGRTDEAAGALEQALERFERKKNLAMVAQVRAEAGGAPCPRVLAAATRTRKGRQFLQRVRLAARGRAGRSRAAQDRHRPLLRRDRLDRPGRVDRPRGAARPARPLLRAHEGDRRVARRDGGEVHRRCGHGCVRRPPGTRGRRPARLPRRGGDARRAARAGRAGPHRRQHRRGCHRNRGAPRYRRRRQRGRAPRAGCTARRDPDRRRRRSPSRATRSRPSRSSRSC